MKWGVEVLQNFICSFKRFVFFIPHFATVVDTAMTHGAEDCPSLSLPRPL